jgi:outer membrane lipase/esterase
MVGDLVVFGDSLADVGNASLATGGTYPPSALYFQGRFSGGPIWVDTLAEYLGEPAVRPSLAGGLDYAFGGALLESNPPSIFGAPSLGTQVGAYLHGHTPTSDDLFALIGGGNDFFETSVLPGGPVGPDQPAAALEDALQTLYAAGGRRFAVANLPPLGQTPAYQDLLKAGYITQGQIDAINGWSAGYDYFLARDLAQFRQQHADAHVIPVDTAGLFQQIIASPASFGFTNVSNAIGDYTSQGGVLTDITVAEHDGYLFYDSVHPGTKAHQLLGLTAAADVYEALGINLITVTNTSDAVDPLDGGLSLREALNLANAERGAQTIAFRLGAGPHTIQLGGELAVTDDVTVSGPEDRLVIDGQGKTRLFDVSAGAHVTLSRLTLTGGSADQGGAIRNAGDLRLDGVDVNHSTARQGGGVYNTGSLHVFGSVLHDNSAAGASAAGGSLANVGANARAQLFGTLVAYNRATGSLAQGGGVANLDGASLRATLTTFIGNVADGTTASQGGAVYNGAGSDVRLTLCLLTGNRAVGAHGQGGGLYLAEGGTSDLVWTLIFGNLAPGGGADVFAAP